MYNEDAALRDFMDNDGYPGDTPAYVGEHRYFPTEPAPARNASFTSQEYADAISEQAKASFTAGAASIFDQPDAATTHAKQTAHALIHEYETFANQPGHWTDAAAGLWIGQACATLAELAK
jgi:hypothetical protein